MSRLVAATLVALALTFVAPVAFAQDSTPSTELLPAAPPPEIIPGPNSGHEPLYAGDRGSPAQYLVIGGIVVALLVIGGLVYRESRKKRAGSQSTRSSTRSEPVAETSSKRPDSSALQ
jgi:hypothetical protein